MQELGVLQMVNEDDSIELYHVHTMKTEEHKIWSAGDYGYSTIFKTAFI